MRTIVSPCGTSLLTNLGTGGGVTIAGEHWTPEAIRALVTREANADTIAPEVADRLNALLAEAQVRLAALPWGPSPAAARTSAEIHALTKLGGQVGDTHWIVHSDTWLGERIAGLLTAWLQGHGFIAQAVRIPFLRTDNPEMFGLAMGELAVWLDETIPPLRSSGDVIFQLSGGFKALHGILQSLAPFYADRVVYLFESSSVLLELPRLPVTWQVEPSFRDALTPLRRLALGLPVNPFDLQKVSTIYWTPYEDRPQWTEWGRVVWPTVQAILYKETVWPPPTPQLRFGPDWAASIADLSPDRRYILNKRVDDFARWVETGQTLNRLDVKKLQGRPQGPSTHECDAWHDQDARRIFCHPEGAVWIWDRLGRHL